MGTAMEQMKALQEGGMEVGEERGAKRARDENGGAGAGGGAVDGGAGDKDVLRVILNTAQGLSRLSDAKTTVILVKGDEEKKSTKEIRDMWRSTKPEVSEDMRKAKIFPGHPCGKSQKALMHDHILDLLNGATAVGHPAKDAISKLKRMDAKVVDEMVGLLQPKFANPKEGRTWVWHLVFSDYATEEFKGNWKRLREVESPNLAVAQQRSQESQSEKKLWKQLTKK